MSTAPTLRPAMQPVSRGVRAYFAPVVRSSSQPAVFDPATIEVFDPDQPPSPWIDLGAIEKFTRIAETKVEQVRAGVSGVVAGQYRSLPDARVEVEFRDWGKLQMALAGGGQHMNVLESTVGSPAPCGGTARQALAVQGGSTATELILEAGAVARFTAGDMVAVDRDYQNESGWIGDGISAAYVPAGSTAPLDQDFIRRVTFGVSRVREITATSLKLSQALPAGLPSGPVKVQKVVGFVDRECNGFFQEWSGLFLLPEDSGGRTCFFYPRLQSIRGAAEGEKPLAGSIAARILKAAFRALPSVDPLDGESVLCYRSYFPSRSAPAY